LYTRVPSGHRAEPVIRQLLSSAFDTGWGLRTLARDQPRFNPMSYHNGSVWPHDTALCAAGMAAYGHREAAAHLLTETFDAALHFGLRLPELYCGFPRGNGEPPVAYPVACLPQAWASGAAFMLLQACLGVTVDGINRVIHFDRPHLPAQTDSLIVRGVAVGEERLDIGIERVGSRVTAAPIGPVPRAIKVLTRA
jgi:glycogen debranching enzyme